MAEAVTIYKNGSLKQVGAVENETYIKKVNRSKHFLRNYGGYAIQKDVVEALKVREVKEIVVKEDSGNVFSISLAAFLEHAIKFDYGFGEQIVVPEKWWRKQEKNQLTLGI